MSAQNKASFEEASPQLKNWVSVESSNGLRTFNLFFGDVTNCQDPAIAVPTHSNTTINLTGAVLESMRRRHKVDFESQEPLIAPQEGFGTFRVKDCGKLVGHEVLLVRVPGAASIESLGDVSGEVCRQALWTLFGSLAALELRNHSLTSLGMPLLGATRGFEIKEIMRIILESSLDWLRASRFMNSVNLYLIDTDMVAMWASAMDEVLGRRVIDSAQNQVVQALREEILAQLTALEGKYNGISWTLCRGNLLAALSDKKIGLERVAAESRALIEYIVTALLKEAGFKKPKAHLDELIKVLKNRNVVAPWILSHFDSLKAFGNAGVHLAGDVAYHPPRLRDEDLTAILAALQRVLACVQDSGSATPIVGTS